MRLELCNSCNRFIALASPLCPFCGTRSLGRAALLVAGLLATSGCDKDGESKPAPADPKAQDSGAVPDPADPDKPDAPDKPDTPDTPDKPDTPDPEVRVPDRPVPSIYAGPPPQEGKWPEEAPTAKPE